MNCGTRHHGQVPVAKSKQTLCEVSSSRLRYVYNNWRQGIARRIPVAADVERVGEKVAELCSGIRLAVQELFPNTDEQELELRNKLDSFKAKKRSFQR
jgi:hypothetical protein